MLKSAQNVIAVKGKNLAAQAGVSRRSRFNILAKVRRLLVSDHTWKTSGQGGRRMESGRTLTTPNGRNRLGNCRVRQKAFGKCGVPARPSQFPSFRKAFTLARKTSRKNAVYHRPWDFTKSNINGGRVERPCAGPDRTDYRKRVRYQVYDVTSLVRSGRNGHCRTAGQRLVLRAHRQRRLSLLWKACRC